MTNFSDTSAEVVALVSSASGKQSGSNSSSNSNKKNKQLVPITRLSPTMIAIPRGNCDAQKRRDKGSNSLSFSRNNKSRDQQQLLRRQAAEPISMLQSQHQKTSQSKMSNMRLNHQNNQQQQQQQQQQSKQAAPSFGAEMWSSVEELFWDHIKEVENKWNTLKLNDDIWAKLIYFERNRRLAKAYVSAPVLTVDGSTHGLDGFRIGLSGIDSTYRSLDSIDCLRSIGLGIKLKIDTHGNILIRRIGQNTSAPNGSPAANAALNRCSVWIKDWPSSSANDENCMMRRILKSDISYKLFDMRKFRLQLEKRMSNNENNLDWRQCVSIISFVRQSPPTSSMSGAENLDEFPQKANADLLENPCWLMLINIIAIDMIKNSMASNNNIYAESMYTSSMQDHSLMESKNHQQHPIAPNRRQIKSYKGDKSAVKALKTSSSSSVLFPSLEGESDLMTKDGSSEQSTTGDSSNNINATSTSQERVKKLRTTGGKYRMSPMKNNAYYRRYQSIQQLSSAASNSTIYTTFNSKFINPAHKHQKVSDSIDSPTSDYNSASRSTSSGQLYMMRNTNYNSNQRQYLHHHDQQQQQQLQLQSLPMDSLQTRAQSRDNRCRGEDIEAGKVFFSRKALIPPSSVSSTYSSFTSPQLDLNGSKSLSAFDLSQPRRFDFRAIQSSIKMNYDYLSETEDLSDYNEDEYSGGDSGANRIVSMTAAASDNKTANNNQKFSRNETLDRSFAFTGGNVMVLGKHNDLNSRGVNHNKSTTNCCCGLLEEEKLSSIKHRHINHNECSATQGNGCSSQVLVNGDDGCTDDEACQSKKKNIKKLSKSSIASSTTSSSGCPDNDYFMSQSSSSMSSSGGGNCDAELFSQPPSSSGIVCSTTGSSTNDELDDGNKTLSLYQKDNQNKSSTEFVAIGDNEFSNDKEVSNKSKSDANTNQNDTKSKMHHHVMLKSAGKLRHLHSARRNYNNGNSSGYCCNQSGDNVNECDCPSVEYTCHCCCDCFIDDSHMKTLDMTSKIDESCGWEDESIYQRLPPPSMLSRYPQTGPASMSSTTTTIEMSQTKVKKGENIRAAKNAASGLSAGKLIEEDNHTTKSIAKTDGSSKQSIGWLEKRKYSKIFPKFMFSSSASSSGESNNSNSTKGQRSVSPLVQEKENKSKFTKSAQDLS